MGGGVFAQPDKTKNQQLIAQVRSNHADSVLMAASPVLLNAAEAAEQLLASITSLPSDLADFQNTALRLLRVAIAQAKGES